MNSATLAAQVAQESEMHDDEVEVSDASDGAGEVTTLESDMADASEAATSDTHAESGAASDAESEAESGHSATQEAPSPVFPETSELVWGGISFIVVLVLLMKFAIPALKKGLKAREDKIRGDLEGAEAAKIAAENVLADYKAQLSDAKAQAGLIIEEARKAADDVRRDLMAKAEEEAAGLKAKATEDIRLAGERAMSDLQGRVATLSIELAEKVVERSLDRESQMALIESYINQVGTQRT